MSVDSLGPFLKTPPRARFLWSLHFSSSSRPRRFCNATPLTPLAAAELPVSETEVEKGCSIFAIQHLYGFLDLISDCVRQPRRSCFMEIKDKCTEAEHSSSSNSHLLRLHEILESIQNGDVDQSENSVLELAEFLDSVSASVASSDSEDEDLCNNAFEMLTYTLEYIRSPSAKEAFIDSISFVLPKAVCKFSGASPKFSTVAESIIEQLVLTCNPRDMLTILCEALDSINGKINISLYLNPLLGGISIVFLSIKRRHFEHVKVTIPVILRALKQASQQFDNEDEILENLFRRAIGIADSIRNIHQKLEGVLSKKLRSLLCLYILQIVTYLSVSLGDNVPKCLFLMSQLSRFFHYYQLSYVGLISGSDINNLTSFINEEEDGDDVKSCFPDVEHGASLAVIWGYISDVAQSAKENLGTVENELRYDQIKRWRAISMLKHIFSSAELSWRLKKHAIEFLLCITEGSISKVSDEHSDFLPYLPSCFAALQGIQMVVIYAPEAPLRKTAYNTMKRVLADIPNTQRSEMLKALITYSNSPSMKAILLDCVREEMQIEANQRPKKCPFWTSVLELVELVLRPPKGGPPDLPNETDAVSSALNLYRFVLIVESGGRTNYSGVLCETNLWKAYTEWLLPLRTMVTGILAENRNNNNHHLGDVVCALNPVELVLYRCIELVEEKLKDHC